VSAARELAPTENKASAKQIPSPPSRYEILAQTLRNTSAHGTLKNSSPKPSLWISSSAIAGDNRRSTKGTCPKDMIFNGPPS
jgi:hypothetical protein